MAISSGNYPNGFHDPRIFTLRKADPEEGYVYTSGETYHEKIDRYKKSIVKQGEEKWLNQEQLQELEKRLDKIVADARIVDPFGAKISIDEIKVSMNQALLDVCNLDYAANKISRNLADEAIAIQDLSIEKFKEPRDKPQKSWTERSMSWSLKDRADAIAEDVLTRKSSKLALNNIPTSGSNEVSQPKGGAATGSVDGSIVTVPDGISRVDALRGLWKCSKPALFFETAPKSVLEIEEAEVWKDKKLVEGDIQARKFSIDYFGGRCIRTDMSNFPRLNLKLYQEQCGIPMSYEEMLQKCLSKKD